MSLLLAHVSLTAAREKMPDQTAKFLIRTLRTMAAFALLGVLVSGSVQGVVSFLFDYYDFDLRPIGGVLGAVTPSVFKVGRS
ncbi:hypothetical protein DIC66_03675 [Rhodoferax lacus]|uniref:Uncharacterized protein n=1 Tax=Rhodoferax lacus TaxID=2184758 RepID=A0A3E1RGW6_9BURK|nr:hypothetical protein DIC66_03675 [Rhodoferax lacus]